MERSQAPSHKRYHSEQSTSRANSSMLNHSQHLGKAIRDQNARSILNCPPEIQEVPAIINKDAEIQELGSQLTIVKKRYNESKIRAGRNESALEKAHYRMNRLDLIENQSIEKVTSMNKRVDYLNEKIDKSKRKVQIAQMDRQCLMHMLERAKKTKFFLNKKQVGMNQILRTKSLISKEEEIAMQLKVKASDQARVALNDLQKTSQEAEQAQERNLRKLEANLEMRQDVSNRRDERQAKNQEVVEAAAALQSRDQNEASMNNALLVNRFYGKFMKNNMKRKSANNGDLETAFDAIRQKTGVQEPEDIVQRYLTKEDTYVKVTKHIQKEEIYRDELQAESNKLNAEITTFKVIKEDVGRGNGDAMKLKKKELEDAQKEQSKVDVKLAQVIGKYDKVSEWLHKLITSLNGVTSEPFEVPNFPHAVQLPKYADTNTLLKALGTIKQQSDLMMDEIKEDRQDLQKKVDSVAPKFNEVLETLDQRTLQKVVRIDPTMYEDDEDLERSVIDDELLKEQKLEESELRKEAKQRKMESNEIRDAGRRAQRAAAMRKGEDYVYDDSFDF